MSEDEKKIILITDLVDQRLRKEQEIEYYEKELIKIQERLSYLYKEKTLTETILCLLYTSPSPRDLSTSRMPTSA